LFLICSCGENGDPGNKDDPGTHEHKPSEWKVVEEPTCSSEGTAIIECTICREVLNKKQLDRTDNHVNVITLTEPGREATCSQPGIIREVERCSDCGYEISVKEIETEFADHQLGGWKLEVSPTCISPGRQVVECTVCHQVCMTMELEPNGVHTPGDVVSENAVEANCQVQSYHEDVVYCLFCSEELSRTAVTGEFGTHSLSDYKTESESTCTSNGVRYKECSICLGKFDHIYDDLKPHSVSDWKVKNAATCGKDGVKYKECTVCHIELETESIPKTENHTPTVLEGKPADWTETGLTEGSYCSVCKEVLVEQEVIPALLQGTDIAIPGFTVSGDEISSSDMWWNESFYKSNIIVAKGASYRVALDPSMYSEVLGEEMGLNFGSNLFYIKVTNGEQSKLYKLTIYRGSYFTVVFDYLNGETDTYSYSEGAFIVAPDKPEKEGYTFGGWDYDFSNPVTSNLTIKAIWTPNKNTPYTIRHYIEAVGNAEWLLYEESKGLTGVTDSLVSADEISIKHFTYNRDISNYEGRILPDGALVLELYYNRNSYTVSTVIDSEAGTVTEGGSYQFESVFTVQVQMNKGYLYEGLYVNGSLVSEEDRFDLRIEGDTVIEVRTKPDKVKYTVYYYVQDETLNDYYPHRIFYPEGTVGESVSAEIIDIEHFVYYPDISTPSAVIKGDGNTEIKLYYKRNVYEFTVTSNSPCPIDSSTVTSGAYPYNKVLYLSVKCYLGYVFEGWYRGDTLISDSLYFGHMIDGEGEIQARFKIIDGLEKFNFTATEKTCVITGVKNLGSTDLTIPNIVTGVNEGALHGCSALESITYNGAYTLGHLFGKESFDNTYVGGYGSYYIPNSLQSVTLTGERVTNYALYNCKSIKNLTIKENVQYLGSMPFNGSEIMNVYIFDLVRWCSFNYKFASGASLYLNGSLVEHLTVPVGVEYLSRAFEGYTRLKSVKLPSSLTEICGYTFNGCTSLDTIDFGNSSGLKKIGSNTFAGCTSLRSVNIPSSVEEIYYDCFRNCTNLETVTFLNNEACTSLSSNIFYDCTSLDKVILPVNLKDISSYAFYGCISLEKLSVPASLEVISKAAFYGCSSLSELEMEENNALSEIGEQAFYACIQLKGVVIPNVKSIGKSAFNKCASLSSIQFGNSLTEIADYAFMECASLKSVTIPASVVSLGYSVFESCTSLTEAYINGSIETIPFACFRYCSSLSSILISTKISGLDNLCFYQCTSLENVQLPSGMKNIGYGSFYGCTNLKEIGIPSSVETISTEAFKNCEKLENISLPSGITDLWANSFEGTAVKYNEYCGCYYLPSSNNDYHYLVSVIDLDLTEAEIHPSAKLISTYAFRKSSITSIVIPDSVRYLCSSAFTNSKLNSIVFGNGLSRIEYGTFSGTLLETVDIPEGITYIGEAAFSYCSKLTSVTMPESLVNIYSNRYSYETPFYNCALLAYNEYMGGRYLGTKNNPYFALIDTVPGSVVKAIHPDAKVLNYAILHNEYITSIVIPEGVTEIPGSTFSSNSYLESIVLPSTLVKIGNNAFRYCTALKSIVIPDGVTEIGLEAFAYCSSLESIKLGKSLSVIGEAAFRECSSLQSVEIPSGVSVLPKNAFTACKSLLSVKFNVGLVEISYSAFAQCESLTEVVLPDGLKYIGNSAFAHCYKLASVSVPDSVLTIGEKAFERCVSLEKVNLPSGLTDISSGLFCGCNMLKSIAIPSGVRSIGSLAFSETALKELTLPQGVKYIGSNAFAYCSLSILVISGEVDFVGSNAFFNPNNINLKVCFKQSLAGESWEDGWDNRVSEIVWGYNG